MEQRVNAVFPLRILGRDRAGKTQVLVAHTIDVSTRGARIAGLAAEFPAGQFAIVQRRGVKCQFQVRWCRHQPDGTWSAGLRCLEPEKNIWDLSFGPAVPDATFSVAFFRKNEDPPDQPSKPAQSERGDGTVNRRSHDRFNCDTGVELLNEDRSARTWARCTDISLSGCYVQSRTPSAPGTRFIVQFADLPTRPCAAGEVRTSDPGLGMGISFHEMREQDRQVLSSYITSLRTPTQKTCTTVMAIDAENDSQISTIIDALRLCREIESTSSMDSLAASLQEAVAIAISVIAPALRFASKSSSSSDEELVTAAVTAVQRLHRMLTMWTKEQIGAGTEVHEPTPTHPPTRITVVRAPSPVQ